MSIIKSKFSRFSSNLVFSNSKFSGDSSTFSNFLSSPIHIFNAANNPVIRTTYKATGNNLNITRCKFVSCVNTFDGGGAISYKNNLKGKLSIKQCAFSRCYTQENGGAVFASCDETDISFSCFHDCATAVGKGSTLLIKSKTQISIFMATFRKEKKATMKTRDLNSFESNGDVFVNDNNATKCIMKYGSIFAFDRSMRQEVTGSYFSNDTIDSMISLGTQGNISIIHCSFINSITRNHAFYSDEENAVFTISTSYFNNIVAPSVNNTKITSYYYLCVIYESAKNATEHGTYVKCEHRGDINIHNYETHLCWDDDPEAYEIPKQYRNKSSSLEKKKRFLLFIGITISALMIFNVLFVCYKISSWLCNSKKTKKSEHGEVYIREIAREPANPMPRFPEVEESASANEV